MNDYQRLQDTFALGGARYVSYQLVPKELRVPVERGGAPYDKFDMYVLPDGAIAFLGSDTATGNVALWTCTHSCASAAADRVLRGPQGEKP